MGLTSGDIPVRGPWTRALPGALPVTYSSAFPTRSMHARRNAGRRQGRRRFPTLC